MWAEARFVVAFWAAGCRLVVFLPRICRGGGAGRRGGCVRLDAAAAAAVAPVGPNRRVFAGMQLTCSSHRRLAGDSPLERLSVRAGRSVPSQVTRILSRSIPRPHDGWRHLPLAKALGSCYLPHTTVVALWMSKMQKHPEQPRCKLTDGRLIFTIISTYFHLLIYFIYNFSTVVLCVKKIIIIHFCLWTFWEWATDC